MVSSPELLGPVLEKLPLSPWMKKLVCGIYFWMHIPTRCCGIHIRGLAQMCGVDESSIRGIIQNVKKVKGEVRGSRTSDIYNLLKDKIIFLEEVRGLGPNPLQKGGPVKVICDDVCGIFIRYYARKGHSAAIESALEFMDFGIEQFILIQIGFIPRPESIVLDEIEYLIAKETVQVNKSRQEEARFFTNPVTGECGIALESLSFLCGGVALKHVRAFLDAQNEPFLNPEHPEPIVKAPICATALQHFGHVHKPRKTLAQHWATALNPIVPTLHQKTHYQASPQTDRETQLELQNNALKKENSRLRQLAKEDDVQSRVKRHRLMGRVLQWMIPENFCDVRLEEDTNHVAQLLDVLILKRHSQPVQQDIILPDGLTLDAEISLLTYKSHQESLTLWTIQELVGHYVGYRKTLAAQNHNRTLPEAQRFALYAVTTMYPQALVKEVGKSAWQPTAQVGVYQLLGFGLMITVIIINEIPAALHNRPWNLLSSKQENIKYAVNQQAPLPADLERYFKSQILELK